MRKDKKGFTLIELMVVIVIIGILAAIAIPKLFGMSAKAKASEVGPAAGTWSKLQQAYVIEKGEVGDAVTIAYTPPGATESSNTGSTPNFSYSVSVGGTTSSTFSAVNATPLGECTLNQGTWSATGTISGQGAFKPVPVNPIANCANLTPNWMNLQ